MLLSEDEANDGEEEEEEDDDDDDDDDKDDEDEDEGAPLSTPLARESPSAKRRPDSVTSSASGASSAIATWTTRRPRPANARVRSARGTDGDQPQWRSLPAPEAAACISATSGSDFFSWYMSRAGLMPPPSAAAAASVVEMLPVFLLPLTAVLTAVLLLPSLAVVFLLSSSPPFL